MLMIRRFAGRALAVGVIALAGVAVGAGVASAGTVGSCSAQGQYAVCVASGTVDNPTSISVTVTASPDQSVSVSWDDVCSQGTGAGGDSGSFTAETPVTRTIDHPYAHPDNCVVSADAQLQDGGNSIRVVINSPAVQPPVIKGYDGKCVDDLGNSSANGTKIVLWSCSGGAAQQWKFSQGKLVHNGRCLTDPSNGGTGTKVILNACSSAKDDLWTHKSNGEYVLAARNGKLCLNDPASSKQSGTQLDVYTCKATANQRWSLP
jgi:hypothetical protein